MTYWRGSEFPGSKPLRCQLCGEQIGVYYGQGEPDPESVEIRCYQCAAVEEAEQITGVEL